MERSIPALIAYNMWMAKKCEDAPYCKIREIMKRFSPHPDQTEKLLHSLKKTVKEFDGETEELHEKIIQADVKLEETEMELESLELANKEMNDTLNNLEKEVRNYTTPSLHSIHSEDLLCLSKIRQLAEEELSLKSCIKELEQKETIFKEHMDKLLTSKEYQNISVRRKMISCLQDLECSGKKSCCMPKKCLSHKRSSNYRQKKKQELEEIGSDAVVSTSEQNMVKKRDQETLSELSGEMVEKKSLWIPNWWNNNHNSDQKIERTVTGSSSPPMQSSIVKKVPKKEKKSIDKPLKLKTQSAQCSRLCFSPQDLQCALKKSHGKYMPPCNKPCKGFPSRQPLCQLPQCKMKDHGIQLGCKPFSIPCDLRGPCEICPSLSCRPINNCRCNCKGKCALGMSDALCNCSDEPLDPSEEYHPTGARRFCEDSNSEEDFCECCECGCEDSDESPLCQCN
ncbi:hypothetical protein WH47_05286 [Habropoda laboriosa]|uniref:Uncharacterized protein n=1 Tax=Habropoda laboriosa TaxID=597456 RepID=A0A0L7QVS0_9HYME|nr:hypothetical protein WH47_05286 [Habropoda laboriosa]